MESDRLGRKRSIKGEGECQSQLNCIIVDEGDVGLEDAQEAHYAAQCRGASFENGKVIDRVWLPCKNVIVYRNEVVLHGRKSKHMEEEAEEEEFFCLKQLLLSLTVEACPFLLK